MSAVLALEHVLSRTAETAKTSTDPCHIGLVSMTDQVILATQNTPTWGATDVVLRFNSFDSPEKDQLQPFRVGEVPVTLLRGEATFRVERDTDAPELVVGIGIQVCELCDEKETCPDRIRSK